jgi:hypothetical protein
MSGFGVYQWPDGKRYEGFFSRDKRQGFGIFTTPDPNSNGLNTYSGAWMNGKQHGYGCNYSSTMKEPKFSIWREGERILKLTRKQATEI